MNQHGFSNDLATNVVDGKITLLAAITKYKKQKSELKKGNDFYDNLRRVPGSYGSRQ